MTERLGLGSGRVPSSPLLAPSLKTSYLGKHGPLGSPGRCACVCVCARTSSGEERKGIKRKEYEGQKQEEKFLLSKVWRWKQREPSYILYYGFIVCFPYYCLQFPLRFRDLKHRTGLWIGLSLIHLCNIPVVQNDI